MTDSYLYKVKFYEGWVERKVDKNWEVRLSLNILDLLVQHSPYHICICYLYKSENIYIACFYHSK